MCMNGKPAEQALHLVLARAEPIISMLKKHTGGPPLTRKPLTRFPLPRFLAYVRASGDFSVSRGPQYSPTNKNFM